jgi:hypothetical protein
MILQPISTINVENHPRMSNFATSSVLRATLYGMTIGTPIPLVTRMVRQISTSMFHCGAITDLFLTVLVCTIVSTPSTSKLQVAQAVEARRKQAAGIKANTVLPRRALPRGHHTKNKRFSGHGHA